MVPFRTAVPRLVLVAAAPIVLGACTVVGTGGHPVSTPGPVVSADAGRGEPVRSTAPEEGAREARSESHIGVGVVEVALQYLGTPYEWGGTDANGFDCSGLIQFSYARFGIRLPRVSTAQLREGSRVDPAPGALRPGDVLGFSATPGGKTSHVGLYVGDGDFIHSSSSGVRISTLDSRYWQEHLVAARRIVD